MKLMTVRVIAKAKTYGNKEDWQVDPNFLTELKHYLRENDRGYADCIYEEFLDQVIFALHENGFLKLAEAGAIKL